jgi:hypothetical protein
MKTFYEMLMILEGVRGGDEGSVRFVRMLGEEGDEPFSIEVEYSDGDWEPYNDSSLAVKKEGASGSDDDDWVVFKNPGRRLEGVPEPVRSRALAWIESQVKWLADNHEPDDVEPRGREWDAQDQAAYDRRAHGFDREDA